jgi:hypothetical protein
MSECRQIGWLVSPNGEIVKYDAALMRSKVSPKSIRLRNVAELHARARIGLVYVDEMLKKCGWQCNCIVQSTTSISLELDKVYVDVSIRKPSNIAYVTSRPGWEYKREVIGRTPDIVGADGKVQKGQEVVKPTAEVTLASSLIDDPWVIQVISTTKVTSSFGGESSAPIYIPVNKSLGDPAKEIARNVLILISSLVGKDKLKVQALTDEVGTLIDGYDALPSTSTA